MAAPKARRIEPAAIAQAQGAISLGLPPSSSEDRSAESVREDASRVFTGGHRFDAVQLDPQIPTQPQREPLLDSFGRDVGWPETPNAPQGSPQSISQISVEPYPEARYTASPEDWRDEIFYAALIDRLGRKAPYATWGDPADARTRHGGNLRGLIERLDYLQGLGVTTLLINPVLINPAAGYHGYWALNFLAVDPQIGTMQDFKRLVAEAHQRGMRVALDMVFNHLGPVVEYEGGFQFGPPKKIARWNHPIIPVELASEEHLTRRGDINNWDDAEQVRFGDLPGGINRLATENPATQDILIKIAKWWIKETDIDGFRLDVYKHIAPAFWNRFFPEIRAYAARLGKNNFMLPAELYDGNPANLAPELRRDRLHSAYNYPAYYREDAALHGDAPTRQLETNFHALASVLGAALGHLLRFLDNHDRPHFLRPNDPLGIMHFALAFVLTTVGIPYIYYGDEQAHRRVPANAWLDLEQSREDMFPGGKFRNTSTPVDGFDASSLTYRFISTLAALRKAFPALRRGEQYVRWSDPMGAGIYALSRIYAGQEVLVVLNSAGEWRSAEMWVDNNLTPAGTTLVDALDSGYSVTSYPPAKAQGGSQVTIDVPPYGVRILVHKR